MAAFPARRSFTVATLAMMPLSLAAGVLLVPRSLDEAILESAGLATSACLFSLFWMTVGQGVDRWEAQCVNGRRWLRACRVHQAVFILYGAFVLAQQGGFLVHAGVLSTEVLGPMCLVFMGAWFAVMFQQAAELSLRVYVAESLEWGVVLDALECRPVRFPSRFACVVAASLHQAVLVLGRATPAQVSRLTPLDLEPLLTSSSPEIRLAGVTACAGVRRAA